MNTYFPTRVLSRSAHPRSPTPTTRPRPATVQLPHARTGHGRASILSERRRVYNVNTLHLCV